MRKFALLPLLCLLLVASACGAPDPEPAETPDTANAEAAQGAPATAPQEATTEGAGGALAGTSWRLVEIQSMDDATGTTAPDDPSLYTMTLNGDGTVQMVLNCNRGNGTWTSEPAGDGSSGSFEFGPLAMTRAACPPPSLDERIAADTEWVRTYLLRDGRLHLSLFADGGIYVWEPES